MRRLNFLQPLLWTSSLPTIFSKLKLNILSFLALTRAITVIPSTTEAAPTIELFQLLLQGLSLFVKPAAKTYTCTVVLAFLFVEFAPPECWDGGWKLGYYQEDFAQLFSLRAGQGSRNWWKGNCINVHDRLGWGSNKTYCLSKHIEIYKYKALDSAKSHNHYQRGLLKDRWQQPETFLPEMDIPFQTTFKTFEVSTNDKSARHKFYKMVDWQCFKFVQNLKSFWNNNRVFKAGVQFSSKRCNLLQKVDSETVPNNPTN